MFFIILILIICFLVVAHPGASETKASEDEEEEEVGVIGSAERVEKFTKHFFGNKKPKPAELKKAINEHRNLFLTAHQNEVEAQSGRRLKDSVLTMPPEELEKKITEDPASVFV